MTLELAVEKKDNRNIIRPFSWLWLNILLIVLILLLVGAGVGFYITKVQQMSATVAQLHEKTIKIEEARVIDQSQLAGLNKIINQQAEQLEQQNRSIKQLTLFEQQKQWRLDEINYLVNLANTSLVFAHDLQTSQRLLEQVHTIILGLHDPGLDNLDQAVQADMQMLASTKWQNFSQIFVQLTTLERQVDDMPLLGSGFVRDENVSPDEEIAPMAKTWRERLKESLQQLKYFVVVRKTANSLLPLIAQEQGEYINQYLHMQLANAQWAALHNDNSIYHSSLEQENIWINRYFVVLNPRTQDVLSVLSELQSQDVGFPELNLDKTINALSVLRHS